MANQKLKSKLILINAPAGSGKTTSIKEYIDYISNIYPDESSLCLTFTNRAVDELKSKVYSQNVDIYTIHEFCNKVLSSFYKTKEAKELYFEKFANKIKEILDFTNPKDVEKIDNYKSKYGIDAVTNDIVKNNIKEIKYNQTNFTAYLYGTLSHDDLLYFIYCFSEKYPKFLDVISKKYKFIFVDEYQDTSSFILKMIYNACTKNKQYLILFGDKMQEIYSNYDGGFDEELSKFDNSKKLNVNYRSSQEIVEVLNNIYNNDEYKQSSFTGLSGYKPEFLFVDDIMNSSTKLSQKYPKALQLYIANRERFEKIKVDKIFAAVEHIKDYQYGCKYQPTDVLLDNTVDNPDTLIKLCFDLHEIKRYIELCNFGAALQKIKKNKYFVIENFEVIFPKDKKRIKEKLSRFNEILSSNYTIMKILGILKDEKFICIDNIKGILDREDYQELLNCDNLEFARLYAYLGEKNISTQHGVKGESHEEVIMYIENSKSTNPNVKIYEFLNLFSKQDVNFEDYKNFVSKFISEVNPISKVFSNSNMWSSINVKSSEMLLTNTANKLLDTFNGNKYFIETGKQKYLEMYLSKKTVKEAKNAFSLFEISGILNAYRLFYVGCSRARKKLLLVILNSQVGENKDNLKRKLIQIGFSEADNIDE